MRSLAHCDLQKVLMSLFSNITQKASLHLLTTFLMWLIKLLWASLSPATLLLVILSQAQIKYFMDYPQNLPRAHQFPLLSLALSSTTSLPSSSSFHFAKSDNCLFSNLRPVTLWKSQFPTYKVWLWHMEPFFIGQCWRFHEIIRWNLRLVPIT